MEEKEHYVYRHYIGDNTFYVGKGSKGRAYSPFGRNARWKDVVDGKKYEVEIVKYFDDESEALAFEVELTKQYKQISQCIANIAIGNSRFGKDHPLYNKKGIENPLYGRKIPENVRKKISIAHRGKILSEETKNKIVKNHARLSGKNHPMYGKKHSDESRQKISLAGMGRTLSEETKRKVSENSGRAKKVEISINGVIYAEANKTKMRKTLLDEFNIKCSTGLLEGNVAKKHRDIIDFIKVENKTIYIKGER